jgi:Trk K+ transport system NAD-binding subunit
MTIPDDADIVGKQLSNIEPLEHSFVSVVVRENRPMPALQDLILKANDEVYAVTVSDEEAILYERLTGV